MPGPLVRRAFWEWSGNNFKPPFPYADLRFAKAVEHTVWLMPTVARAASDFDHSDRGHSAFGEERSEVVYVACEEDVIGLAYEGESGVVDIVSSGGGEQQSCGLGQFDGEGADVDGFECLCEACLTSGAPPYLSDYAGVGHDLLFGLVGDGEACPHGSVVPVEGDERTGVEDQSAHAAEGIFFLVRGCTICFLSASAWRFSSSSENAPNSAV